MKSIISDTFEIIARKRAILADGTDGWTGVRRMSYSPDCTVVGFRKAWWPVPDAWKTGAVGGHAERKYAKHITSDKIRELSDWADEINEIAD